jgi:hypothetical protein
MAGIVDGGVKNVAGQVGDHYLDKVLEGASNFLTVAKILISPSFTLEKNVNIDQIGIRIDAVVGGDVYIWKQQYDADGKAAGGGWAPASPSTFSASVVLFEKPKFLNLLDLSGPANQAIFLADVKQILLDAKSAVSSKTGIKASIEGAVDGLSADVVKYDITFTPAP